MGRDSRGKETTEEASIAVQVREDGPVAQELPWRQADGFGAFWRQGDQDLLMDRT